MGGPPTGSAPRSGYRLPALVSSLESAPVGDGDLLGEPFRALPYQRRFLRGAFRPGVLRAGLSLARGGGKTGLASALALDSIRPGGALHVPGGETVVLAASFQQARLTFEGVVRSLELLGEAGEFRVRDQQNLADIQHRGTGARLRVAGSDNRRAHGWRFNLALCDEPSQWGPRGELLAAAVRTALGKRAGARALFLGTRPRSDSHFFARLLAEGDRSVYAQVHAARPGDPPYRVATWRRANPGLDYGLPDVEVLRAEARLARRDPAEAATFAALRLNLGTSEVEEAFLLAPEVWRAIETDPLPPRVGPCAWGVDLGGTAAFSACAAYWPRTGRLEGFVACGAVPPLADRALRDGVSGVYEAMRGRDELVLLGRRVVPVEAFVAEAARRFGRPQAIAADRYRAGELTDGVAESGLRLPEPTWRGQGWRDGAEDVRGFRVAVLEGRVAAPVSLAMRAAFAEARTVSDAAANEKLSKGSAGGRRARGRDDLAAAIVLAVAEGSRRDAGPRPQRRRYALAG